MAAGVSRKSGSVGIEQGAGSGSKVGAPGQVGPRGLRLPMPSTAPA